MSATPKPAQVYEQFMVTYMFRPFASDLVARAAPQAGERVLDVGCGTGVVARLVAATAGPSSWVAGLDPNRAMLEVAREHAEAEGLSIEWHTGDATAMPFPDGAFDLVLSQQALQFVPDKLAAAREVRRVLAPGGRVLILTWAPIEQSPVVAALDRAIVAHLGASGFGVPHGMGGPDVLRDLLNRAGFSQVETTTVSLRLRMPSYVEYVRSFIMGASAVVPELARLSAEDRARLIEEIQGELRPRLAPYLHGEALDYPAQTDIATAWR